MSWIRDLDDNLVNLDHVARLEVVEVEDAVEGSTHALVAKFPREEEPTAWLAEGNQTHCRNKLEALAKGVHIVRF